MHRIKLHVLLFVCLFCNSKAEEKKYTVNHNNGMVFSITTEKIDADNFKVITSGCSLYKGQLYFSDFSPPHEIIKKICLKIDEKEIDLDCKGLTFVGDKIEKRCIRISKEENNVLWIDICFMAGGAIDYCATWVIHENLSLRYGLVGLGDQIPEWIDSGSP